MPTTIKYGEKLSESNLHKKGILTAIKSKERKYL